jgi:hypothetical protein
MTESAGFTGEWNTTWTSAEGATGTAPLTVTVERRSTNYLDGVWVSGGVAAGYMHGKLSGGGLVWEGTWWVNFNEHGDFRFELASSSAAEFTGTYTQVEIGDKQLPWNGTRS